ncbi:DUF4189 domain-containing protein [Synechocystis sp. CACIAM 05]|uniref:DUF4189 domain-containing protein n=1 Tax=Synechocystis sp. CACIAM 05 TaxID=1933929 RepID=UPI00138E7013|nr:DUF4189 domain-containing protein [Synechocystis sp. CACIAM 05]QHV01204.1 hypothetical protein BWK47_14415 [Synechocystis sp. CACIAM 05]
MKIIFSPKNVLSISGLSLLGTCLVASPALAGYSAIAQGVRGWGWATGYSTMEKARQAAIRNCRGNGGGSCSVSTAEKDDWYFVGGYCGGMPYTAASKHNWNVAADILRRKAKKDGNYNCHIEVER